MKTTLLLTTLFAQLCLAAPPDANCNDRTLYPQIERELIKSMGNAKDIHPTTLVSEDIVREAGITPVVAMFTTTQKGLNGDQTTADWIAQFSLDYAKCELKYIGALVIWR